MENSLRQSLYGFEVREPDERRVEERKSPNIKQMWQRTYEIIGMVAAGMKHTEVAKVLGITPATVSNAVNSDLGMKRLSELRTERDEKYKDVAERIALLTQRALDIYEEVLEAEKDPSDSAFNPEVSLSQQLKVADTVMLELSGHRAAQKVHSLTTTSTLKEIEEFKKRGRDAMASANLTIEAEVNEPEK